MFELVTISNGMAVVQRAPGGRICRFRPTHPGVWNRLTSQAVDKVDGPRDALRGHERAARCFAEPIAAPWFEAADFPAMPVSPSRRRSLLPAGALRQPGHV